MNVRIVTDSTCDLPPEILAEHTIAAVPLHIDFGTQSDLEGAELTRQDDYARLAGAVGLACNQAPVQGARS